MTLAGLCHNGVPTVSHHCWFITMPHPHLNLSRTAGIRPDTEASTRGKRDACTGDMVQEDAWRTQSPAHGAPESRC